MIKILNDWRLSKKMVLAFALLAVVMSATAGASLLAMSELSAIAKRHVTRGIAGTEILGQALATLREQRVIIWSRMNASESSEDRAYAERMTKSEAKMAASLAAYRPLAGDFAPELAKLAAAVTDVQAINARTLRVRDGGGVATALAIVKGDGKTAAEKAMALAEDLVSLQKKRAQQTNSDGEALTRLLFILVAVLTVSGFGMLFAIWRLIGVTVARPLGELSGATQRLANGGEALVPHRGRLDELGEVAEAVEQFRLAAVARAEANALAAAEQQTVTSSLGTALDALSDGDLTAEIVADFPAGYVELKTNFNAALASLRELIGSVLDTTTAIHTGSGEIAQASEDLARRTEANAASLEETSAAIGQIDHRLKAGAIAAAKTVERADGAMLTVAGGRSVAEQAGQAMTAVSESAKGIDNVIEGLDKIAFQTRVLAMNAAVEAGRAGEAGRGFAVVADLVSALAMRAEEEARRARDQLTATQQEVLVAFDMVQKVDLALVAISEDVGEVHVLLEKMALDNQAQSTAVTQISIAIGAMDHATQQNAAMVEETSAAARNLSEEVGTLSVQAAKFEVERRSMDRAPSAGQFGKKGAYGRLENALAYQKPMGATVRESAYRSHSF